MADPLEQSETPREVAESIARRGVPFSWLNNEDEYKSVLNWFADEIEAALNAERERCAKTAETKAGARCMRHQQSGRGVCGYEIANLIRASLIRGNNHAD